MGGAVAVHRRQALRHRSNTTHEFGTGKGAARTQQVGQWPASHVVHRNARRTVGLEHATDAHHIGVLDCHHPFGASNETSEAGSECRLGGWRGSLYPHVVRANRETVRHVFAHRNGRRSVLVLAEVDVAERPGTQEAQHLVIAESVPRH